MAQIIETGTIDLKSQKAGHDDAATKATDYITTVTNDGIMVADAGSGASSGSITSGTTGWHIGGVLEFIRQGVSRFWIGLKNSGDTTPTVRIGKEYVSGATDNESHMELDYHSMQMLDKEGNTYFHVSDLRDSSGYASVQESFVASGDSATFSTRMNPRSVATTVATVNGSPVTVVSVSNTYPTYGSVTLASVPSAKADVVISYETPSYLAKAYTFGYRTTSTTIVGAYSFVTGYANRATAFAAVAEGENTRATGRDSHAFGINTNASGIASVAEGSNAKARGDYSHAEGMNATASGDSSHAQNSYTIAASDSQTAIGKYNVPDANDAYALIIGNGTADNARSNASVIDWLGNYIAQGWAGITQMFAGAVTQTVDSEGVATATGAPAGWLLCDGSAVSRDDYATLYAAIGDTWGAGDGSTTFNLPDLRGRAPIGAGTGSGLTARTLGGSGGSEDAVIPYHRHAMGAHTHADPGEAFLTNDSTVARRTVSSGSGATNQLYSAGTTSRHTSTGAMNGSPYTDYAGTSGNATGANMQPFAVVNYIIHTGKTS